MAKSPSSRVVVWVRITPVGSSCCQVAMAPRLGADPVDARRLLQERRHVEVTLVAVDVEIVVIVVGAEHVGDRLEIGPAPGSAAAGTGALGVVPAVEAGGDDG